MKRNSRQLHHLKSTRVKVGTGAPSPSEGSSGDLTLRMTKTGVKLFAKFSNKWYIVGQGNLNQLGGTDEDQLFKENVNKITAVDDRGKVKIKEKGSLELYPWNIQSAVFDPTFSDITGDEGGLLIDNKTTDSAMSITREGQFTFVDNSIGKPTLQIQANRDDTGSGAIQFLKDRNGDGDGTRGEDGDLLGTIRFRGYSERVSITGLNNFATIAANIVDTTNLEENGSLTFRVLTEGSSIPGLQTGLLITGTSTNDEVDVSIGNGLASQLTVAGDIEMGGDVLESTQALRLNVAGSLTFDSSSGNFYFEDNADSDDRFQITVVGGTGATTLETISAGADGHLTLVSDGNTIIDSGAQISLDAETGDIFLKDSGTTFAKWQTAGTVTGLILYEAAGASTDDYFAIAVGAAGATTIATVEGGGAAAHLTFDVDGDITLNSGTGVFHMEGPGTTAKFADMYAGMILGYRSIGVGSLADHSGDLPTSFAVIDDNATIRFIAPPSQVVEVTVQAYIVTSSNSEVIEFGLSTTDTTSYTSLGTTYEQKVYQGDRSEDGVIQLSWVVTGLTAGDTYNYWLAAEATTGTTRLYWGGTATSNYPDFIMKVTALPAAVSDFAVYG